MKPLWLNVDVCCNTLQVQHIIHLFFLYCVFLFILLFVFCFVFFNYLSICLLFIIYSFGMTVKSL